LEGGGGGVGRSEGGWMGGGRWSVSSGSEVGDGRWGGFSTLLNAGGGVSKFIGKQQP